MHHVATITRPYGGFGPYRVIMGEDMSPEPVMVSDVDTESQAKALAEWWSYLV